MIDRSRSTTSTSDTLPLIPAGPMARAVIPWKRSVASWAWPAAGDAKRGTSATRTKNARRRRGTIDSPGWGLEAWGEAPLTDLEDPSDSVRAARDTCQDRHEAGTQGHSVCERAGGRTGDAGRCGRQGLPSHVWKVGGASRWKRCRPRGGGAGHPSV